MFRVDAFLNRWLPRHCVLCGRRAGQGPCCNACAADLPWVRAACEHCGTPRQTAGGRRCGRCDIQIQPAEQAAAALIYEYPVDRLVSQAKYQRRTDLAYALGEMLAEWLSVALDPPSGGDRAAEDQRQSTLHRPDAIVPIPLHRWRYAWRGYNQALDIARPVAARLNIELRPAWCHRVRHTSAQTGLTGKLRRRNLRGAFWAAPEVAGQKIALIDDVLTTGSTAAAAASACRKAGAEQVVIWTVARTV